MPVSTIAIIPARFASTRFPGKPLADLDGEPMIVRVARRVSHARSIDHVIVATDDRRIFDVVRAADFVAVMTPVECATGTDRIVHALEALTPQPDLVLNVQGDEPLIDPRDLDALVTAMKSSRADMGTLARPLPSEDALHSPHVVKVAVALGGRALYFTRAPIAGALQHVGVYAYRPAVLSLFPRLPRSRLELAESLEQLRALEHGLSIHVARCVSEEPSVAIDVPEDVDRVLQILRTKRPQHHGNQ